MTGTLELLCGPSGVGKTTSSKDLVRSSFLLVKSLFAIHEEKFLYGYSIILLTQ